MTGEKESRTIDERYADIDAILKDYESSAGIPKNFKINTEKVMEYLQMERDELKTLDLEDCAEISFALSQCAFYVQKQFNEEKAKLNWCDSNINALIAAKVGEYKGYSFEERKLKAISDNDVCLKLNRIKVNAKLRVDRLDGLSAQIQFMSKSINDLKFAKRGNTNG